MVSNEDIKNYFINKPLFLHGDFITKESIESIRRYRYGNVNLINKIFQDSERDSNNKLNKWKTEIICSKCKNIQTVLLSKSKLIEYIKYDNYKCEKCKTAEKEPELTKEEIQEIKNIRTRNFIESYLNINNSWNSDIRKSQMFWILKDNYYQTNYEEIIEAIKEMKYNDFLQTPYWKAISMRVKITSNFKCKLCGSGEKLSVHHSTYENHGDEINHVKDLVCICQDCHQIYHDNKEIL